jgi:shikimate kinase
VVQEIQEVLQVREPIYQAMADWIVDADAMDPHGLCEQIVRWWKVA